MRIDPGRAWNAWRAAGRLWHAHSAGGKVVPLHARSVRCGRRPWFPERLGGCRSSVKEDRFVARLQVEVKAKEAGLGWVGPGQQRAPAIDGDQGEDGIGGVGGVTL